MIKTTLKEIKKNAMIHGREELKKYLNKYDLSVETVELVAYSWSIKKRVVGSYLAIFTLSNNERIKVATDNRTSWNYTIEDSDFGLS